MDKERADRVRFPFKGSDDSKGGRSISPFWFTIGGIISFGLVACAWRYRRFMIKRSFDIAGTNVESNETAAEKQTCKNAR